MAMKGMKESGDKEKPPQKVNSKRKKKKKKRRESEKEWLGVLKER